MENTDEQIARAILHKKHMLQQLIKSDVTQHTTSDHWVIKHLFTVLDHAHMIFTTPENAIIDDMQQSIKLTQHDRHIHRHNQQINT